MTALPAATSATTEALSTERIRRHRLIDRLYHWTMAATVLTLMFTAFWPTVFLGKTVVMGDPHWIAGVVLVVLVVFHIIRALFWQNWRTMMVDRIDVQNIAPVLAASTGRAGPAPRKTGKYNGMQKLFHFGVLVLILTIVGTGCFMIFKIGTPPEIPFQIIPKNPYIIGEPTSMTWDVIYALHGLAGAAMVGMIIIHVYYALRPDEFHLIRSMLRGWISGEEYRAHFDSTRWSASEDG